MPTPVLKYLFEARFVDGHVIYQPSTDASIIHPLSRSSFWDVQNYGKSDLVTFTLRGFGREHTVDLRDGHFTTDGMIISSPYGKLTNYRVIYFRRVQVVSEGGMHKRPEIVAYFLGWQANDYRGQNKQMVLEIAGNGCGRVRKT